MKQQSIYLYLILAVLTAAVYWQVHSHEFISTDDPGYITMNSNVQKGITFESIIWSFKSRQLSNWHPLTWLSHMLDFRLFGLEAGRHHLVNLLFHIANTLLLFVLLRRITADVWPGFFVAAVFALHPAHIESVAWASGRKDVLSMLFFLLTLLAYAGYTRRQTKLRYILVLAGFALGLMAKPMVVTLPFVLLLLDYWPLGRFGAAGGGKERHKKKPAEPRKSFGYLVWEKLPLFALSVGSSAITFYVQKAGGAVTKEGILPFDVRFFNAIISYGKYVTKFFWPVRLAFFYPYPPLPLPPWQIAVSIAVLLCISVFVLKLRRQKYLTVGWLWFLGTLVPVIGLVQVGGQAIANRYTYIPYIGLSIMVAWGMRGLIANKPYGRAALASAMLIVIAAMSTHTYVQLGCWKDGARLYSHALEVTHHNYVAHQGLADCLYRRGRIKEATAHLVEALKIMPDFLQDITPANQAKAHNDLAVAYFAQGNSEEALKHYGMALKLDPNLATAHSNFGAALLSQRKFAEALDHIKRSLEIEPDNLGAKNNLAWILATGPDPNMRNPSEAIRVAQEACSATNYMYPGMLDTLAAAYASAGRFTEAVETAQKALSLVNQNHKDLLQKIQTRLDLYKVSMPYIAPQKTENGIIK
jgi:Flp pilus assembly protein TadD